MRILFTGGGTGGHFYPIISVAEELNRLAKEKRLLGLELFYMSPSPYNESLLFETGIIYRKNSAGKLRRAGGVLGMIQNFFDLFRTGWGILLSVVQVYSLYPDVVFGKGGYASFPALLAARILRIPVVIHESDTVPGRVNLWAGKFAQRIAVSYPEAATAFPVGKAVHTGQPVRHDVAQPITEGAREFLKIEDGIPVILILGGSQGARKVNEAVLAAAKDLVAKYAVIHQAGPANIAEVKATAEAVLFDSPHKDRYKSFDYLNQLALRMAAGVATVAVSRAGSSIFEIASWGLPSIIIPINKRVSHDQHENAFAYARSGACEVVEENNLTGNILASEIARLVDNPPVREKMAAAAKAFYKPDAAKEIAEEILKIALEHEVEK
ncbi:UDP-N-acetylglucosamine--N-acetylmuramyl-(pentapeptide) pyrophosphoryl-undecaprenol N-acetylglucosamine transferase [Candidatus Parcubacteria bacterium]|nr:UDP-N-acetylglucosamine--N-acetylmuramyl-(pentapeptide) pyrophosphoryl-undecaprenol N-acetylglucosamine transferase [Candidatus Parcubacteria bacterium]